MTAPASRARASTSATPRKRIDQYEESAFINQFREREGDEGRGARTVWR